MDHQAAPAEALSIEKLLQLHNLTKELSQFCQKQLRAYLDTMSPLFRPRRILGDLVEGSGREPMIGAERNFSELADVYKSIAQKTFDLRPELGSPLESISTQMQLEEWEYNQEIESDRKWRNIRVKTPLTWVLSYSSQYSLNSLREVLAGKQARDEAAVRAFVLRACVLHLLFQKFPGLTQLLAGLRYRIEVRNSPEFGLLPLVTISPPLNTIRPADQLVVLASGLAGGSSFSEVIDPSAIRDLRDPLREDFGRMLSDHGGTV